ncbi:cyclophilin-like domain-containing protein [Gorgonomyces haynaldii]|nr:cyclophilin-like domain-containing protein [Gorgonomyces haynaldii]
MRTWFEISINNEPKGRFIFDLFTKECPKTTENFSTLCQELQYKGSIFHRVIKGFMIQGGDYTNGDGTGGKSIYGDKFEDENLSRKHDEPFLLSMANKGPNTNGSQFFVTSRPVPHLDGKHCVFGKLISGQELFREIEDLETDPDDRPLDKIEITNCGILEKKKKKKPKEVVEENPLVAGVPLPPDFKEPPNRLMRNTDAPRRYKPYSRKETDADGRQIKGRGSIKYRR